MKLILFVAFLASAAWMTSAKKLLVVGGLNGGALVPGLNGGLLGQGLVGQGLLGQGLVVGGLNPALLPAGGALIGQTPVAQMLPAINPFMLQPPVAAAPFMFANPQAQLPQQPAMPFQPMMGMPFVGAPNRQILPPQQQAAGLNPMGNGQQPQGDMPAGPVPRFRRTLLRRMQDNSVNANAQVTPTPTVTGNPNE